MEREELKAVRNLNERLRQTEAKINNLRGLMSNLVPVYDGMPHAENNSSRENLLVKILDLERLAEELRAEMTAAQIKLTERLCAAALNGRELAIVIRRYVYCQRFRDIGLEMGISEATTFRVHDAAVEKLTVG